MLAVRAIYREGKLEWVEPPPADAQGMVAVVFLETNEEASDDLHEAALMRNWNLARERKPLAPIPPLT